MGRGRLGMSPGGVSKASGQRAQVWAESALGDSTSNDPIGGTVEKSHKFGD